MRDIGLEGRGWSQRGLQRRVTRARRTHRANLEIWWANCLPGQGAVSIQSCEGVIHLRGTTGHDAGTLRRSSPHPSLLADTTTLPHRRRRRRTARWTLPPHRGALCGAFQDRVWTFT